MAIVCQLEIKLFGNSETDFQQRIIEMTEFDNPITVMQRNEDLSELTKEFSKLAGQYSTLQLINDNNITQWLLNKGETDLGAYRRDYVVGGEFVQILHDTMGSISHNYFPDIPTNITFPNTTVINGLYNSIAIHSRPLAVNLMSNTLLRYLDTSDLDRTITSINHPLPSSYTVIVVYIPICFIYRATL